MSIPQITQLEYPQQLYQSENKLHEDVLHEYGAEIFDSMLGSLDLAKPNLELYQQQPYLTPSIRLKLIDFLLKMSIRLKIIPFVFFRAVKIFDRYCSKRVILLDQSQLIITTCLWIASKVQGGNNHFLNLNNLNKLSDIKTISDLGYGSGGKYLGPTERFRLPKLHELVKLCGAKCKYDQLMFRQMELHILQTLDWAFNDPSIDEFLVTLEEFSVLESNNEFFYIKQYLAYVSLYSYDLIDCDLVDLAKVIVDLVNEVFGLNESHMYFQSLNTPTDDINDSNDPDFFYDQEPPRHHRLASKMDYSQYKFIKKSLIKCILGLSEFMLGLFLSKGPQYLYNQILVTYKDPFKTIPVPTTPVLPVSSPAQATTNYIYKPVPLHSTANSSLLRKYSHEMNHASLPRISTQSHHHNNSQASINSAISRDTEYSIFDDQRMFGVYTPVSDEESPIHLKNFHQQPFKFA